MWQKVTTKIFCKFEKKTKIQNLFCIVQKLIMKKIWKVQQKMFANLKRNKIQNIFVLYKKMKKREFSKKW